ncbi:META domain-containing protein [Microbacterium sp. PMB16]|uniref:META domain-containing protein n=1 Tax=Microbacterium sp. PMB16 TaxID=3120157 RepID=UPI003F4C25A0
MSRTLARTLIGVAVLGILTMVGTACTSDGDVAAPTSTPTGTSGAGAADIVGLWGEDATGKPSLEFTADGEVRGSDGCNGIVTTYTVEGDRIALAPFASTLKACMGVDDWLRGARAAELDGDVLVALDATGERLGELARSG